MLQPRKIPSAVPAGGDVRSGPLPSGKSPQLDASEDGLTTQFLKSYNVLDALPGITHISDSAQNNFILMANETPHEGVILQKPDYVPSLHADNTEFEGRHEYIVDGRKLDFGNGYSQEKFYHANMATMLRLGEWFDYLRENNVYDNTRIILVSDHAAMYGNFEELLLEDGTDATIFYPLLMVKDFGSTGFTTSDKFMTNGDVPTLAADGLIRDPVNPFTGKIVNSDEKTAHVQYVYGGHKLDPLKNGETAFLPAVWYTIHDNIWEKDNWGIVAGENVLPTEG